MAAKKKEIRKAAAPAGAAREAEDRQPLRAREGQEDADDRRLAGRGGEGAGAEAARRGAGDLGHDSRHRRTARRQAQSRHAGKRSRRAAARAGHGCADHRARARREGRRRRDRARRRRRSRTWSRSSTRRSSRTRPTGITAALQDAIAQLSPTYVLLPHTYQTRDFAPKLAARLDRALITDVTAVKTAARRDGVRPADVPGQADRRRRAAGAGAAFRHVPDRRVPRRSGRARGGRRRRCAR